ncbi:MULTISPECIES: hypothetical protein [Flavobacterium]|uniref:Lipocalin-like domain-containing protein n=1 Tax=Flavobacterium suzhouense TaxID=1529638 RepID=A0ABW5NVC8_9FLAO|nr:hypothetical protein [Flavobacterium sp. AG291]RDI16024.1 hypothetical protein DEU42_101322 [Flavobacterium sp. AG291]
MKKLIFLFSICLISLSGFAQKITSKELEGNWKLAGYNQNGITVDVATGAITVSPELKNQISPEMMSQIDQSFKQLLEPLRASNVTFTNNNVVQHMAGKTKNGTFVIKDKDGQQVMTTSWSDQTTSETSVWIKDKQLYIFKYEQGQSAEFVFNKV